MASLFLLDCSSYLFRSFYALPPMNSPSGKPVHALHGLARSIIKLIEDFKPDHLVAVFDGKEAKKRRRELYPEYKAHRSAVPPELIEQIVQAPALCAALGLQTLIDDQHEADDLIAAACHQAREKGHTVYICSSDKDLLQLVGPSVYELHTHKENALIGPEQVKKLLGVEPFQVADWLALCGDSSDNIPGVEGIGPKTAAQLLEKWGNLENLIAHLDELGPKKKEKFDVEIARISKKLATLHWDFEFTLDWRPFALSPASLWKPLLTELGLRSILKTLLGLVAQEEPSEKSVESIPRIASTAPIVSVAVSTDSAQAGSSIVPSKAKSFEPAIIKKQFFHQTDLFDPLPVPSCSVSSVIDPITLSWQELYQAILALPLGTELHIETFALDYWSISVVEPLIQEKLWVIEGKPVYEELAALARLEVLWQSSHVQNTHIALESAVGREITWKWHGDLVIAAHLYYGDARSLSPLSSLEYALGLIEEDIKPLFEGTCQRQVSSLIELMGYFKRALKFFSAQLDQERLSLYREIEVPLAAILAKLHGRGFFVNRERLKELSQEMHKELESLKNEIITLVGQSFNLNSPKQLASLLFETLQLPIIRKTKTGASTDSETLSELADKHPVVPLLLKYRELEKLRSTYLDALPTFIKEDGAIHPYFEQSATATGRLSCHQPNLQNIPVRTPQGLKIRSAFIPRKDSHQLLSADYSQIELRIMAHLSEDPSLIEAFQKGEDIHRYTAALVFEKTLDEVQDHERSLAKAVNFGIIYGQQAFGLSKQIGVSLPQAAQFIHSYFERYPGVKRYLESCKEQALSLGYVKTLFGRRRQIPEIKSPKHSIRQLGERLSINTPVQGSAAELIKLAMIKLEKELENEPIAMILQVHDELIFEGSPEDLQRVKPCIQGVMESIVSLKVPLVVNINVGKNWMEC